VRSTFFLEPRPTKETLAISDACVLDSFLARATAFCMHAFSALLTSGNNARLLMFRDIVNEVENNKNSNK
jgi:hypothetical protein